MPITEVIVEDSSTRARRTDGEASHLAARRSQRGISRLRLAVLRVLASHGPMTGAEMNTVYRGYAGAPGFPTCHYESPRKRVEELATVKHGCLVDVIDHLHGTKEAVYRISFEGRRLLEKEARS